MQLHKYTDVPHLNAGLAKWLSNDISTTLAGQERYTIALSGGNTPKAFNELLAREYHNKIDWQKVHVFFCDERYVPFEDDRNNARMTFETLLSKVDIPRSQVHIMQTDIPPAESAAAYENLLRQTFSDVPPTFDLVLLGMGDDGHTLSLFPGTAVVIKTNKWVSEVLLDAAGNYRITLTAPMVNQAAKVAFLVAGAGKAQTLNDVINGAYNPAKYPSQLIQPVSNQLHWFVDKAAAGLLNSEQ